MQARALCTGLTLVAAFLVTGAIAAVPAGAVIGSESWNLTVDKTWNAGSVSGSGTDGDGNGWSIGCGTTCSATINNACAFDPDFHDVVCEVVPATISAADGNGFAFQFWQGCASVSGAGNRDCNLTDGTDANPYAVFADVQAPTASLTTPAEGALVSGTLAIGADWADNSDNIWAARWYVRKVPVAMSTTTPFARDFDSTTVADGPALIEVTVEDTHGNVSAPSSATVMIDNNPPSISNFSGGGAGPFPYGSEQSFTWVAADNPGSGIKSVECKLDAGSFAGCSSSSGQSYRELALGQHTFTVKVTDNADRVSTRSATWSIEPAPDSPPVSSGTPNDAQAPTAEQPRAVAAIAARVGAKWVVRRGKTRVKKLALRALPLGATVEVACKGRGCPFKTKRFVARNGSLDLRPRFKKELARGTAITIKITKPGMTGELLRYVTRKKGAPRQTLRST